MLHNQRKTQAKHQEQDKSQMEPQMALNQVAAVPQNHHAQKANKYRNVNYLIRT